VGSDAACVLPRLGETGIVSRLSKFILKGNGCEQFPKI
jgi:hypothetical protein